MIREFLRRHGWAYALGAVLLVACIYMQTLSPLVLGEAIDALGAPDIDAQYVGRCALQLVGIAVAVFLLRFAWRFCIIGGSRYAERMLRRALCVKFQSMPVGFYHKRRSGDLLAYAINDIGAVRMTLGPGLAQMLTSISTAVFSFLSMSGSVHMGLTLAALAPVPFAAAAILRIGALVRERFRRVQQQFALLSGHVNENIMGMRVIKTFVQEEAQEKLYDGESEEMMRLNVNLVRASASMSPITQGIFGLSFLISIAYGGTLVSQGEISLGDFATFNAYLLMIMQPIVALGRIVNILQRGQASVKRLRAARRQLYPPARPDAGRGRPHGLRKKHAAEPDYEVLYHAGGHAVRGRAGHPPDARAGHSRKDGLCAAGRLSVLRNALGEHCLLPAGRGGRGGS